MRVAYHTGRTADTRLTTRYESAQIPGGQKKKKKNLAPAFLFVPRSMHVYSELRQGELDSVVLIFCYDELLLSITTGN